MGLFCRKGRLEELLAVEMSSFCCNGKLYELLAAERANPLCLSVGFVGFFVRGFEA